MNKSEQYLWWHRGVSVDFDISSSLGALWLSQNVTHTWFALQRSVPQRSVVALKKHTRKRSNGKSF